MQRQRHQQGDRPRVAQRHPLRRQLSHHDVQHGDGQERGGEADRVHQPRVGAGEQHHHRFEHPGERRLADPAQAERRQGDAELRRRQVGFQLLHHAAGEPRPQQPALDLGLELGGPHPHQRELGGDEKAVDQHQQEAEQQRPSRARALHLPAPGRQGTGAAATGGRHAMAAGGRTSFPAFPAAPAFPGAGAAAVKRTEEVAGGGLGGSALKETPV